MRQEVQVKLSGKESTDDSCALAVASGLHPEVSVERTLKV